MTAIASKEGSPSYRGPGGGGWFRVTAGKIPFLYARENRLVRLSTRLEFLGVNCYLFPS